MSAINVLIKPSSGVCNIHCGYCFYCDGAQKRLQKSYGFIPEETLKNMIRKIVLWTEGAVTHAFQGGESTLRGIDFSKKAVAYEAQYNRYHMQVRNTLQTNRYLLDDEWCRFLKENHSLVGLPLDGIRGTNDIYRRASGCGSVFDRIFQVAKLLEKHGVDFNIFIVVTNNVVVYVKGTHEFYRKQNWDHQQYIACLDPLDRGHGKSSYTLLPEQYRDFLIALFHLWYEDQKKGCQPYIYQLESYTGILVGCRPETYDQCGVYNVQNVVEADDSVYPCDLYVLDEYRLGNFNTDQLDNIDRRHQEIGSIERSEELKDSYLSCSYYNICRGDYQRSRDLGPESGLYDNYSCESYRIFFDAYLPLMEEIAKKQSTER